MDSRERTVLGWLNAAFFTLMVTVNALANVLRFNDRTTGEVSSLYPNLFTPASVTFSIWSVIYLFLFGFIIYQWKVFVRNRDFTIRQYSELSLWFILSCVLNIGWLLAWHYLLTALSVAIMFALLFTLVRLFLFLNTIRRNHIMEKAFIHLPFTLYLAWICVAMVANVTAFLVSVSWNGWGISPEMWTIVMAVVVSALLIAITFRYQSAGFAAVAFWALLGIFLRWESGEYVLITYAVVTLMVTSVLVVAYLIVTKRESLFR